MDYHHLPPEFEHAFDGFISVEIVEVCLISTIPLNLALMSKRLVLSIYRSLSKFSIGPSSQIERALLSQQLLSQSRAIPYTSESYLPLMIMIMLKYHGSILDAKTTPDGINGQILFLRLQHPSCQRRPLLQKAISSWRALKTLDIVSGCRDKLNLKVHTR